MVDRAKVPRTILGLDFEFEFFGRKAPDFGREVFAAWGGDFFQDADGCVMNLPNILRGKQAQIISRHVYLRIICMNICRNKGMVRSTPGFS